jgi:hypothetical protein
MIGYIIRRLFYGVLILIGVNLFTFVLFFAVPLKTFIPLDFSTKNFFQLDFSIFILFELKSRFQFSSHV